jgi:hypothetical protein
MEEGEGGIHAHFCVEHFKGNLSKHVIVKPNRSRLMADFLWGGGGDGDLATNNFSISSLDYSPTNPLSL